MFMYFGVWKSTSVCRLSYVAKKRKDIKSCNSLWFTINKRIFCTKIIPTVKDEVNDKIIQHPHVIVSPIKNCVRINFIGLNENYPVPNILIQISVRDIHKYMVQSFNRVYYQNHQTETPI